MIKRLIRWIMFSVIVGLLPLAIKAGLLYLCGITIDYNDVYAEIVFFALILNVNMINESISLKNHEYMQLLLISLGIIATIALAVMFALLILISYNVKINLDFKRMQMPANILVCASLCFNLFVQVVAGVKK